MAVRCPTGVSTPTMYRLLPTVLMRNPPLVISGTTLAPALVAGVLAPRQIIGPEGTNALRMLIVTPGLVAARMTAFRSLAASITLLGATGSW